MNKKNVGIYYTEKNKWNRHHNNAKKQIIHKGI